MTTPENNKNAATPDMLPLDDLPEPTAKAPVVKNGEYFAEQLPFEVPGALSPLSPEARKNAGWVLKVNGEEITDVRTVEMANDRIGARVSWGMTTEGYDAPQVTERGGPVTIPYMRTADGQVWIGMVQEKRSNMGGMVWNVPRGMLDAHETLEDAAKRELHEETGHNVYQEMGSHMVKLAKGINANSAYLNTSQSNEQGATFFAVPIKPSDVVLNYDDNGEIFYSFPKHVLEQARGDATGEKIANSRFIPIEVAQQTRDGYTQIAAGLLLSYLGYGQGSVSSESRKQIVEFSQRPDRAIR